MDELSPLFQEIEFHERYRGYDPDEVDAFVDRVARAAAVMRGRIAELHERVDAAEARGGGGAAPSSAEETLTRTLVLAQRTADAAIAEAREEADRITSQAASGSQAILSAAEAEAQLTLREAQAEASSMLREAEDRSSLLLAEAETDRRAMLDEAKTAASEAVSAERERLATDVSELHEYRDFLADDIEILERHLTEERHQLTVSLSALTDLLESPEVFRSSRRPATSGVEIDADLIESSTAAGSADLAPVADVASMAEADTFDVVDVEDIDDAEVASHELVSDAVAAEVAEIEAEAAEIEDDQSEVVEVAVAEAEDAAVEVVETEAAEAEDLIDLVAAEQDAAESAAERGLTETAPDPDPDTELDIDVDEDPAYAVRAEHAFAAGQAPPRLVTAADLDSPGGSGDRLGFETSTFDAAFEDGGPPTEAVPTVTETSLFADDDSDDDDPFLAQLRDAVDSEPVVPTDDEALSAFFDQEEDDSSRSWFGRRR